MYTGVVYANQGSVVFFLNVFSNEALFEHDLAVCVNTTK